MHTPPSDTELRSLAVQVGDLLHAQHRRLATAESCTGGWVAKVLTDIPGSSSWFERGFVTYSDTAKKDALGVDARILQEAGAVSRAVALQMAEGARRRAAVDIAVAVTGIAGPDGGTLDKPVGTVWFAWSRKDHAPDAEAVCFRGDRDAVRRQSVAHALRGLIERLAP